MPPEPEVLVLEDVWGPPFDELARRRPTRYAPQLWADRPALLASLDAARAVVVRNRTTVDAELLDAAPSLKVVARAGTGLENIDVAAADDRGVVVVAAAGVNARSVAEHTLALALALARGVAIHDRRLRAGIWQRDLGQEISGRTWGVVGYGATGRAVAQLASAIAGPVLAFDPAVTGNGHGVTLVTLDTLLAESDVVSLHLPSTPETRNLFDARLLASMRPGSFLVNVGRGDVLDEAALATCLREGTLGGAALDVRASEPPTPGPLDGLDNVVLTPHVAGLTEQANERIVALLATEVDRVLAGGESPAAAGAVRRLPITTAAQKEEP